MAYSATTLVVDPQTGIPVVHKPPVRAYRLDSGALVETVYANGAGIASFVALPDGVSVMAVAASNAGEWIVTPISVVPHAAGSITNADLAGGIAWSKMQNYADATWVPSLAGDAVAGAHTYLSRVGNYVRLGDMVIAWFQIALSVKDPAMAGNVYVNLPFASRNIPNQIQGAFIHHWGTVNLTAGWTYLSGYNLPTGIALYLAEEGDNVISNNIQAAQIASNTFIRGTAIYLV